MLQCGTDERQREKTEDRATQPMEAGGWVSQQCTMGKLKKMAESGQL